MDDKMKITLRAIKHGVSTLVAQVDDLEAFIGEAEGRGKSAPSKTPAVKVRPAKSAAQSFAEEVIEEVSEDAEEIEKASTGAPKKRGRPKGSKNAAPTTGRKGHGESAAKIRERIEDLGVGEAITTSEIAELCEIAAPNASREATKLVEAGVLERAGRGSFRIRALPAA